MALSQTYLSQSTLSARNNLNTNSNNENLRKSITRWWYSAKGRKSTGRRLFVMMIQNVIVIVLVFTTVDILHVLCCA
jgi:hypothetical protein